MGRALFDRTTGLYTGNWSSHDDIPHDPATHIQIVLAAPPDPRSDRWDGANGVRPATAQELADIDEGEKDKTAGAQLAMPLNLALRDLLLDIEQRLRAAGQTSTLPGIAAAANKADYTAALKQIVKLHS